MPIFILNKLVRDKLRSEYERLNQQATYRALSRNEHVQTLKQKIAEEAAEIPLNSTSDDVVHELADVQQALDDLAGLQHISSEHIRQVQQQKFDKKGGFTAGTYVETLTLDDTDEWVEYYRRSPALYHEVDSPDEHLQLGVYEHYKGNRYDVIGVGKDTESEESVVIYRPLYESDVSYWVRPYTLFTETVTINGLTIPRFKKVTDHE